jgi:serine/threonine-protein kinase HipA
MTSKPRAAYVWIWLPGESNPVVAGRLFREGAGFSFLYGQSYLARNNAIAISENELPLKAGRQLPLRGLSIAGCLRDAAPDAWGRRVILNKLVGAKGNNVESAELDELTYFLESGSDRIGALDFQSSATNYLPRQHEGASLEELLSSAQRVEEGIPLSSELDQALLHGSSIGGARPKALIGDDDTKYIAKFSLQSDTYNIVKGEFVAMHLGKLCGLDVAPVKLTQAMNKDVLLIERFDVKKTEKGWNRRAMQSALTLLQLDEMMARYASYEDLAEIIRRHFANPIEALKELYARLVFNILCGNNDDHARNHAAFWDGKAFTLTPAYDICPQNRVGREASQAMLITGNNRSATLLCALEAAWHFLVDENEAITIMQKQIDVIQSNWAGVCDAAELNPTEREFFWQRQFLNPFAFENLEGVLS